jgi:hypothetical protein
MQAYNLVIDLTECLDLHPDDLAAVCNRQGRADQLASRILALAAWLQKTAEVLRARADC